MTPFLITGTNKSLLPILQYLIKKAKVNIFATDYLGNSVLHIACIYNNIDAIVYLIQTIGLDKEIKNKNNETTLHYAAYYGNHQIINYLLKIGAKKYTKNNKGETPYDVACKLCESETININEIKSLLEYSKNEELELSQEIYHFNSMRNFRELGGYKSNDGRCIKHNIFFRGPKLSLIENETETKYFQKFWN